MSVCQSAFEGNMDHQASSISLSKEPTSHLQNVVAGKFFSEVLTGDEREALLTSQVCKSSASARKELKASIEKKTLNYPKMSSSAETWRKIMEEAAGADIGLHRQRMLTAGRKVVKHWPEIQKVVSSILENLAFYQRNAGDGSSSDLSDDEDDVNMPFQAIIKSCEKLDKSTKKRAMEAEEEEEEEDEESAGPEGEENEDDEEESCADLLSTEKCKSPTSAPPKKKGRTSAPKKEYVIPGIHTTSPQTKTYLHLSVQGQSWSPLQELLVRMTTLPSLTFRPPKNYTLGMTKSLQICWSKNIFTKTCICLYFTPQVDAD